MEKMEVRRKLFHIVMGALFAALMSTGFIKKVGLSYPLNRIEYLPAISKPILLMLIIGVLIIITCRKINLPIISWILEKMERPSVRKTFPGKGVFLFLLGTFVISLFLETQVVAASIFIVSIGDSVSYIVGKRIGRIENPLNENKKIEGSIAGALLAGIVASLVVLPLAAFLAAFVSMFLEGIQFKKKLDPILEDNFFIPIVSGIVIATIRTIFI